MARRSLKKNVEALAAAALMAAAYAGMRLVNAWLGREKKPQPPAHVTGSCGFLPGG